jgi:hypothetical protein
MLAFFYLAYVASYLWLQYLPIRHRPSLSLVAHTHNRNPSAMQYMHNVADDRNQEFWHYLKNNYPLDGLLQVPMPGMQTGVNTDSSNEITSFPDVLEYELFEMLYDINRDIRFVESPTDHTLAVMLPDLVRFGGSGDMLDWQVSIDSEILMVKLISIQTKAVVFQKHLLVPPDGQAELAHAIATSDRLIITVLRCHPTTDPRQIFDTAVRSSPVVSSRNRQHYRGKSRQ